MHIDWLVNLRIAYDTPQPMDVYIEEDVVCSTQRENPAKVHNLTKEVF